MYDLETNQGYDLEERRKIRKKQRAKRRLKVIKRIFLFLLFAAVLVLTGMSQLFGIKSVEVGQSSRYSPEQIISIMGPSAGDNGFKSLVQDYSTLKSLVLLRFGKSEQAIIDMFPYIKSVRAQYILPGKVKISLTEREPFVFVAGQGQYLLLDREGFVLETAESIEGSQLPVINGIEFEKYELGHALTEDIGDKIKVMNEFFDSVEKSDKSEDLKLMSSIEDVNLSDLHNLAFMIDGRIRVNIGRISSQEEMDYKISFIKQIFFKHIGKQEKGRIDFTDDDKPRFIPEFQ